jgi:endonuclease/exonuclease/phosphatase family metal-dependent hydrolase
VTTSAGGAAPSASSARPLPLSVPPDAGVPTRVWLLAVLTVACLDAVRASGPLLDRWFAAGTVQALVAGVLTYAEAGLVAAVVLVLAERRTGVPDARTVLGAASIVVVGLLTLALLGSAPPDGASTGGLAFDLIGLFVVGAAVAALTLTVAFVAGTVSPASEPKARTEGGHTVMSVFIADRAASGWPGGARQAALGLVMGCGLSVGLHSALGTWDALWRDDWVGWLVTIVMAVAILAPATALTSPRISSDPAGPVGPFNRPRRLWALGPFVAIAALTGANPAFAASQSGVALGWSALVLVLAFTAGGWLLLRPEPWHGSVRVAAAVLLVGGVIGALRLADWGALIALAVLDVAAGIVLTSALNARRTAPPGIARTAGATAVAGLGIAGPLLLYYLDYDVPLPVDNAWVVVLAAVVLALTGLRRRTPGTARDEPVPHPPARVNAVRLLLLPAPVLALLGLIPGTTSTHGADVPARAASNHLTVVDWNLHYEVSPLTAVDLEGIAREIDGVHPDVVTLQEVERGWVLGGGVDAATWLAHRLGMTVAFAPAADRQFGNAVLSRSALQDVVEHPLPYGAGPQHRSALSATIVAADGTPVRITSVHLQHRASNTPTRLDELQVLLADEPASGAAVLAGDLNATPGSQEVALVTGAGWTSAVDEAGDTSATTSTSLHPTERIDWVFGHGVVFTGASVPVGPRQSDHLPVVARVTVSAG